MVISWLVNVVVKDIGQSILFSANAPDAWLQLEQRFGDVDGTKVFRILRDLYVTSQNNLSVADYFTQIKKLWDDYNSMISIPHCNCCLDCASLNAATKMIKDQQLMQFLVGLNDDYKVIRGGILMMKPLPSIDQVYQLIAQEEKQRSLSAFSQINNNVAAFNASDMVSSNNYNDMAVQQRTYNGLSQHKGYSSNFDYTPGYQPGNNFNYGQGPQIGNNSGYRTTPRSAGQDKRQYFCDHCKIAGHTIQRCYKVHGYAPGHRLYKGKRMAAAVHNDQPGFNPTHIEQHSSSLSTLIIQP